MRILGAWLSGVVFIDHGRSIIAAANCQDKNKLLSEETAQEDLKFRTSSWGFDTTLDEWFDIYSLTDPAAREELQIEGLRDSVEFIISILNEEAKLVSPERVFLLGLSQGSAMGMSSLYWAGFVSICRTSESIPRP